MDYFNQESKRLIYRRLEMTDIDSWTSFFEDNDRLEFLGIDLEKDKETLATDWILKQLQRYENDGYGHLAVIDKESNQMIGMGGLLTRTIDGKVEYEIAYSLKPFYWNMGYGTEIAKQIRSYGIQNNVAPSFISIIHKQNKQSIHVAQKNGMQLRSECEYLGMSVYIFSDSQ